MQYKKILILGPPGSGKSTLARHIANKSGLPLLHLDREYFLPGCKPAYDYHAWRRFVQEEAYKPAWIMDGNYYDSLNIRISEADLIILICPPLVTCLSNIIRREIAYRNKPRPDMREGCTPRIDRSLIEVILTYPLRDAKRIRTLVAEYHKEHAFMILKGNKDIERILEGPKVDA